MTKRLRAVFDTNVFVSAFLSRSPTSPTKELIRRWRNGEFILLISDALLDELVEKLIEQKIDQESIIEFLALLERLAEFVEVSNGAVARIIFDDPDDDYILACAIEGKADYLISYDVHFTPLKGEYRGIKITKALPFLWTIRGDTHPKTSDE